MSAARKTASKPRSPAASKAGVTAKKPAAKKPAAKKTAARPAAAAPRAEMARAKAMLADLGERNEALSRRVDRLLERLG